MSNNLSLIKALATTLISEIESLKIDDEVKIEEENFNLSEKVKEFEIKIIKLALLKTGGNQTHAAKLVGVKNSTLHNKIKTYKIEPFKFEPAVLQLEQKDSRYEN
jgi:DNA-binding NtrC family response regulator